MWKKKVLHNPWHYFYNNHNAIKHFLCVDFFIKWQQCLKTPKIECNHISCKQFILHKWKTNTNSLCPNSSESKPLNFFEITNNQKWLNSSSSLKNSTFVFQILNLSLYNMRIMRDRIGSNPILQTFTNFHTGTVYWFYYLWQHFLKQCTTMTIYTWSWKVK